MTTNTVSATPQLTLHTNNWCAPSFWKMVPLNQLERNPPTDIPTDMNANAKAVISMYRSIHVIADGMSGPPKKPLRQMQVVYEMALRRPTVMRAV